MPVIPKLERQKLASSVVGTPGADTSGAIIAETVSGTANTAIQVFGKKITEKKQIQQSAELSKYTADANVALEQQYIEHRKTYRADPTNKTSFFRDSAQQTLAQMADTIPDREVRAAFEKQSYEMVGQKSVQELRWADQQSTQNTIDAITTANDTLANEAYIAAQNKDINRVNEIIRETEKSLPAARGVFDEANVKKLSKNVHMGAVNGFMETDPAFLNEVLKDGAFKSVLDPEDIKKIKADAVQAVSKQKERQDMEYFTTQINTNQGVYDRYLAGTLTYGEIEQIPDDRFAATMKKLYFASKPYDFQEQTSRGMELMIEKSTLMTAKNVKAGVPLQKIVDFQRRVIDDFGEGKINAETAKTILNPVSMAAKKLTDRTQAAWFEAFNEASAPYDYAVNAMQNAVKKNVIGPAEQMDTLVQFNRELIQYGEKPTEAQYKEAYLSARSATKIKYHPETMNVEGEVNAVGTKENGVVPVNAGGVSTAKATRNVAQPKPQVFPDGTVKTRIENGVEVTYVKKGGKWLAQ